MAEKKQLFIDESKISELTISALNGWEQISSPKKFPRLPGLYIIYSWENGTCLYIGQAQNLCNRGRNHWAWKRAKERYELPCIIYKVINNENLKDPNSELIYAECLLIGLIRPQWNSMTPPPRSYSQADDSSSFKLVYWKQLIENKYDEAFNELMLRDEGYVKIKQVKIIKSENKTQTIWASVFYDKEYALTIRVRQYFR